jgi:hypothetical protein
MKTKAEEAFEKAVDECISQTNKLTDELLGMIGTRDRKILELEDKIHKLELDLKDTMELKEAWKRGYYDIKKKREGK